MVQIGSQESVSDWAESENLTGIVTHLMGQPMPQCCPATPVCSLLQVWQLAGQP